MKEIENKLVDNEINGMTDGDIFMDKNKAG